jgi:hypothetical protein
MSCANFDEITEKETLSMLNLLRKFYLIHLSLLFILALSASCQNSATKKKAEASVVTVQVPVNQKSPKITGLTDLGGLDIPLGGGIPTQFSDERFSPGEWVLVRGTNLGATSIDIDGVAVNVNYYFGGNPLIQVPKHLAPLKQHKLTLQTALGSTTTEFYTSHYISAMDTDDRKIHLIRTHHDAKGGVEEEWLQLEGKMDRPLFALVSPDSRFLYAIGIKKEIPEIYSGINSYQLEIVTYHLAYPNKPSVIHSWVVDLGSSPIDATLNSSGTLLLLGKRSFAVVDVSNPANMRLMGSKKLPDNAGRTTFVDAVFLNQKKQMAFLETYSNTVYLFENNAEKKFPLLNSLKLLPSKTIPLSVDLEVDNKNDNEFWVLEGPNYRLSGDSLEKVYKALMKKESPDESERYVSQLQKVQMGENSMSLAKTLKLPDNYVSFFSKFSQDGRMLVTMTKLDFINVQADEDSGKNLLKKMTRFLWDAISIGRVISLNTETGSYETAANGVGLYYDLVDVPDIGPVFSLLKFGPSFSFPYMAPSWGVGIKSTGTYAKRAMNGRAIFPPYSVGFVDYQY